MTIVSNTSPISNLAKVGQLNLMPQLYGTILIPPAVYAELLDSRAGETVITAVQNADWLEVRRVQNQSLVNDLRTRLTLPSLKGRGFFIHRGFVRQQDFSNWIRGNLS